MPYIAIQTFPKDEVVKEAAAEKLLTAFSEIWGCPPEYVTISIEEVPPEEWEETVVKGAIEPKMDRVMILSGKKTERKGG